MKKHWDFRQILDIDPDTDFKCVGIAKSRPVHKCTRQVGIAYRKQGSQILDQMDLTEIYSDALSSLEDLADRLLCKQDHSSVNKPHLNQTKEMYRKWYAVANEAQIKVKRKAERVAAARTSQQLADDDLERLKGEMAVVDVISISEGVLLNPESTRTNATDDILFLTRSQDTKLLALENPARPSQTSWPAVPQHPPSRKISVYSDGQQEVFRRPAVLMENQMHRTAPLTANINRNVERAFNFSGSKSDENTSSHLNVEQMSNSARPLRLVSRLGLRNRVALQDKSASANMKMASSQNVPSGSGFAFGATASPSPFSFEVPKHSHAGAIDGFSIPEASSASPSHLNQESEEEDSQDPVVVHQSTSLHIDGAVEIPTQTKPESFGYAIVTPPSTRYKTYLPAQQQHGLMTPPETPDNLVGPGKSSSPLPPPRIGDYFANDSIPRALSPNIMRKPLPVLQALDIAEAGSEDCVPRTTPTGDDGSPDEGYACLSRFGFSRLRNKCAVNLRKIKAVVSKTPR